MWVHLAHYQSRVFWSVEGERGSAPKRITYLLLLLPNSSPSLFPDPKLKPVVTPTAFDELKTEYIFAGVEALISPFHPRV